MGSAPLVGKGGKKTHKRKLPVDERIYANFRKRKMEFL